MHYLHMGEADAHDIHMLFLVTIVTIFLHGYLHAKELIN